MAEGPRPHSQVREWTCDSTRKPQQTVGKTALKQEEALIVLHALWSFPCARQTLKSAIRSWLLQCRSVRAKPRASEEEQREREKRRERKECHADFKASLPHGSLRWFVLPNYSALQGCAFYVRCAQPLVSSYRVGGVGVDEERVSEEKAYRIKGRGKPCEVPMRRRLSHIR